MKGTQPTIIHRGKELAIRRHDIYFLYRFHVVNNEMPYDEFNRLDVDNEAYFNIIRNARSGDIQAIGFLRGMMNNLHDWGLYGENHSDFFADPAGIVLDGGRGMFRVSDKNVSLAFGLISQGLTSDFFSYPEYQDAIVASRDGDVHKTLWLVDREQLAGNIVREVCSQAGIGDD